MMRTTLVPECYVFSQDTLQQAIEAWVERQVKKAPEKEEAFLVVQAALPWFMRHLNQATNIYTFTADYLDEQLVAWKNLQLMDYGHQKERITETCELLGDFFHSPVVRKFKMVVGTREDSNDK